MESKQVVFEQSYLALVEFLLLVKQRIFELAAQHGMSGMQAMALLLTENPRQMSSFKQIFNCDASNVTGIIDALQQKKLVTRYENSQDRRIKMVKLLAKGRRLRATLLRQLMSSEATLLAKLSPKEADTFMTLVQKITDSVA